MKEHRDPLLCQHFKQLIQLRNQRDLLCRLNFDPAETGPFHSRIYLIDPDIFPGSAYRHAIHSVELRAEINRVTGFSFRKFHKELS